MSYFSGTFPKKFCRSDDHRPSNKPEPLYNDFWDTQLSSKSRNSWAVFKTLMLAKNHENCSGSLYLRYKHRVKKLGQFIDQVKSYATLKFRKNEVFVSKMHRYPDPSLDSLSLSLSLSPETIFSLKSRMFNGL